MTLTLQVGDKVALVAPASGQKQGQEQYIQQAVEMLEGWGLSVAITPPLGRDSRYLSAADKTRAKNLIDALTNPEIKAVFNTRGGYGCARLIPFLSNVVIPSPRFLIGFSDITTLHLYFAKNAKVCSVHSVNIATQQCLDKGEDAQRNQQMLHQLLFQGKMAMFELQPLFPERIELRYPSELPSIGGCLSLLVTTLGTDYEINTVGKILFIEEVGESPYKVDRMLTHLKSAGKFDQVAAVVIGDMVGCETATIAILDVLRDIFYDSSFPMFLTRDFGHGSINLPWIYG